MTDPLGEFEIPEGLDTPQKPELEPQEIELDGLESFFEDQMAEVLQAQAQEVQESSVPESVDVSRAQNENDPIILSDTGNGRRFTRMYVGQIRYVKDRDQWMIWKGGHWELDETGLAVFDMTMAVIREIRMEALLPVNDGVREAMDRFAANAEGYKSRQRMLDIAKSHEVLWVAEDDLDADPNLLGVQNGVVDLLTGELRESTPDDLITRRTSIEYDPTVESPLLDEYLETFIPDKDDQDTLFGILGTLMRGGNPTRIFPIFIGGTTSGKSQLIAAVHKLMGNYICSINSSVFRGNLDDKPRPDLVRAMYTRIGYAVEASKVWDLHADQVKRMTGGDSMPYRNLYSQMTEAVPRFSPLIVTNEMPRIKGADDALRRRLIIFPFDRSLPPGKEDTAKKEKFVNDLGCLQALLARMVRGVRHEAFFEGTKWPLLTEKLAVSTMKGFSEIDHISEFLDWMGEQGFATTAEIGTPMSQCARASDIYLWYRSWIKKYGDKQDKAEELNIKAFGHALEGKGWVKVRSDGMRWSGILLTNSPDVWFG